MNLSVTSETYDRYLKVTVTGQWQLDDVLELIQVIKAEAERAGRERVLVDLRGVDGRPSQMDRFFAGKQVAEDLGKFRIAVVSRPEYINKFAENTAVNRGARFAVMPSEEEAINWLGQR